MKKASLLSVKATISTYAVQRQGELDARAQAARAAHIAALRAAILTPVDDMHDEIARYVVDQVTIGREDGYPCYTVSPEAKAVILAARRAGIIGVYVGTIKFDSDGSLTETALKAWEDDYRAWDEAHTYLRTQTHASL